jgi:hypothetical protein
LSDTKIVPQTEHEAWGLSELAYRFAVEYSNGAKNMVDAFADAYGSGRPISKGAMQMRASRIFHSENFQAFLKHLSDRKLILTEKAKVGRGVPDTDAITDVRIKAEEACLAFSSIKDLYDEHGNFIPIPDLPEHVARAISEFEGVIIEGEDGKRICLVKKLKFYNKGEALKRLEMISGMLKDGDINVNLTLKALLLQIDGQSKGKLPADVG